MHLLGALEDDTLLLVLYRLRGGTCLKAKAKELDLTLANAHVKVKSAIDFYPWVGEAISIRR